MNEALITRDEDAQHYSNINSGRIERMRRCHVKRDLISFNPNKITFNISDDFMEA